ncbi:MAG: xanthine dehydrogenase family protein molybdopterin-binding subunit [Gemmataceae bacterium]|nr:xanthine dehydrogenase family protein molybdopterin-binding subunit [Gemmataceae bacterium]MDW8266502.1 xanthine dehydrogenase family protein molybdopterin-binding subunit [Gemmataceae bacterium]
MQNEAKKAAHPWPKQRRLIGTRVRRIDGPEKATGTAKYSYDYNRPGMLHAAILRCPHAHARLVKIDLSVAEKMPGVKATHLIANEGKELFYAGDEIVALAADTEEHLADALRAVKVQYEVLPFFVREKDALEHPEQKTVGGAGKSNVNRVAEATKGNVEAAYKTADAVIEGEYGAATVCHQCLESHGLVAEWDKDGNLTVWCSTQAVVGTAAALAQHFKLPPAKVKCITHYMGGGFGSKFGPDVQGIAAAELAKKAGAPVKLMLDRAEEITVAGNRPSAYGKVKIAGTKDGLITAYEVDCYGTPGIGNAATVNMGLLPYVYQDAIPNWKRNHAIVRLNAGAARAMRAPGHPQNCLLTECAIDDLAAKLGLDPMVVRLKNLPPNDPTAAKNDPTSFLAIRHSLYSKEIEIAAQLADWKKKWHPPGAEEGPIKRGIGMALHTWGGFASAQPNEVTIVISRDGSVLVESSTQDLGTGQRTVNALVAAEILGLEPGDITVRIGESQLGSSSGSGGSTTCPSQAPATLQAACNARDDLFAKIAPRLGAKPEDLAIEKASVVDKASGKKWSWKEACARLGMDQAKGTGVWNQKLSQQRENANISNGQVGGVQIAEVVVDTETGVVRCTEVVAVQDCGMIVDLLTCESQVAGGVIMGLNYALFEERIMDRHTGRQVNADMEFYKLGGIKDMPRIKVHMYDMPERGVIGIGEPPTISTAAAISNAIFNAIGVRVPFAPFTPDRVLAALAQKGGKA